MNKGRLTNGGNAKVEFACPECGAKIRRPLYWYKTTSHYVCKGCHIVVLLDDDCLTPIEFAHLQRYVHALLPLSMSYLMLMRHGLGFEVLAPIVRQLVLP